MPNVSVSLSLHNDIFGALYIAWIISKNSPLMLFFLVYLSFRPSKLNCTLSESQQNRYIDICLLCHTFYKANKSKDMIWHSMVLTKLNLCQR